MPQNSTGRPLRVALFSGNYNYVKDGANQALNRLVGRMLERGIAARVYSPVVAKPAFPATGTLIGIPSVPLPGRSDYRLALGLPRAARADLARFAPDLLHLAAPDWLGFAAKKWGRARGLPVVASVHTRFETYFDYYGLGFLRRTIENLLHSFYSDLAGIYAPSAEIADMLRRDVYASDIGVWSRGVDRRVFRPDARDEGWRAQHGGSETMPLVGFVGRLVAEKGLDVAAAVTRALQARGVPHRFVVVGEGPARREFEAMAPEACFTGFLAGDEIGRAFASFDVFLNPSITETFGNVTLEAMASGVATVGAEASGTRSLITSGTTGTLVAPGDIEAFADAVANYCAQPELRRRHGAAALARAAQYDWDAINDSLIDRYFELVGRAGG